MFARRGAEQDEARLGRPFDEAALERRGGPFEILGRDWKCRRPFVVAGRRVESRRRASARGVERPATKERQQAGAAGAADASRKSVRSSCAARNVLMSSHSTPMGESGAALRNASVAGSSSRDRPTSRPWTRSPRAARSRSRAANVFSSAGGSRSSPSAYVSLTRATDVASDGRLTKDDAPADRAAPRRARSPRRPRRSGPTTSVPPPKPRSRKSSSRSTSAAVAPTPGHRTSAKLVRRAEGQHQPAERCAAATRHAASATAFATASRPPAME